MSIVSGNMHRARHAGLCLFPEPAYAIMGEQTTGAPAPLRESLMRTYQELYEIAANSRNRLESLLTEAHRDSLSTEGTDTSTSIVAIGREDGSIVQAVLLQDEQRPELYILAAYPHVNPIEAVVLYADEKAQILNAWCLEQGMAPPEQGEEEGDVPYLGRMISWIRTNTPDTAGDILTGLIREQLLDAFDAANELEDALRELSDLAQGIVRPAPQDDDTDS